MKPFPTVRIALCSLVLAAGFVATAHAIKPQMPVAQRDAQTTKELPGQQSPEQQAAPEQKPAEKPACISENSGFKTFGKEAAFAIILENSCAQRWRCKVSAYVVTSQGPTQANVTLTIPAMAHGQPGQRMHKVKIKAAGGSANSSRHCEAI